MRDIDNIIIARCERTVHPDLTCDLCKQQYEVGLRDSASDWHIYTHPEIMDDEGKYRHLKVVCPELVKVIVAHNGRICCPKCKDGVLIVTAESKFNSTALLNTLRKTWTE